MATRKRLIAAVGAGAAAVAWWAGLGMPVAGLAGLIVAAVLLVTLTRPADRARGGDTARDSTYNAGWGSPATNMLLWGGLLFGWANGTGGASGDHANAGGGLDGGGFDAGGGFDGGGGGAE